MRRRRRRHIGVRLAAAAVIAAGAVAAIIFWPEKEEKIPPRIPVILNEYLTNSMSDTLSLAGLDKDIESYLRQNHIQGASLAIVKNDSLVYAKGYGRSDDETEMTPRNILRLASVSKLITAVGIMVLEEQGKLSLDDHVFGEGGILSRFNSYIKDKNYHSITVEHLLRHQGGFTVYSGDPMFSTRDIILQNHLSEAPGHDTLMQCLLKKRLSFAPGTSEAYSNFGFLILSMIIEEVTGEPYEKWMQDNVLRPAGCHDFHIAANWYSKKYPNETRYYMQANDPLVQCYDNSGRMVERCYGGNDIQALSGAGAWVASAPELARFVASIDGRPQVPDIISETSVEKMTRFIDKNTFSLGWNDTEDEWSRTGSFSGTSALIKYYPDGECWVMISNTSTWRGSRQSSYTAGLFKKSREKYSALLPVKDLFYF